MAAGLQVVLASFAGSGLLAILLLPALRRHAMDVPNARSSHDSPTPRGGGIAVVTAVVGTVAFVELGHGVVSTLLAVLGLAALGLVDDLAGLHELVRFGVQALVSFAVSFILIVNWLDGALLIATCTFAGALWLTAFTNAFNFMDGLNGMSAVSAGLAAGWYLWLSHSLDLPDVGLLAAALLGASAGFLPLNFPRARIFLGDVGSYGVGVLLGCLAMLSLIGGADWLASVAPLLVYAADTGWTLARRMHRREKWWKAHRENVYQRLTANGAHPIAVTLTVGFLSVVMCIFAALDVPITVRVAAVSVVLVGYLASPNLPMWARE